MFGLFGNKKKKEEAKAGPVVAKAAAKVEPAKAVAPVTAAPAPVAAAATPAMMAAVGAEQVKLRLRLVAAVKSGETAAAYRAAKGLADIQARAGRRIGAKKWAQQAERILELDPEAA